MVDVLVIPDGAAERPAGRATSLELARTPAIDALCATGAVRRVRTIPPGVPAGSEAGIPALLGWPPPAAVGRGPVEAAAAGIALRPGEGAWRCDVLDAAGERAGDALVEAALVALRAALAGHRVLRLRGHRVLLAGPGVPKLPAVRGAALELWPGGVALPRTLDGSTVVVCGPGAAAGCARLMGARVIVPGGATGGPGGDLRGKAVAAVGAIARGAARVVVHAGGPDEAAHARDPRAKVAELERIDRELVAPLAHAVHAAGGRIAICPDHGCDPRTGVHDARPVPAVCAGAGVRPAGPRTLTERAVAGLPVALSPWPAPLEAAA